jgi:hypothetical protein
MPRGIMLSVFVTAASVVTACAADLPAQSRVGAIFAEPYVAPPYAVRSPEYRAPVIAYNQWPNLPWAAGGYNYGSPYYYYRSAYYGGPYYGGSNYGDGYGDGARLPYVCGLYGYC